MPIRAQETTVEPEACYEIAASGINRLRADTPEIDSIFASLPLTRRNQIISWFTSDKADIDHGWGYVPYPDQLPSLHWVYEEDVQNEKYIGDVDTWDDTVDTQESVIPFQKTIVGVIRGPENDPSLSAYFYKIVKHIMMTGLDDMTDRFKFKNIMFRGNPNQLKLEGGVYLLEYHLRLTFMFEEKWAVYETLQTIQSADVDATVHTFEIPPYPHDDPRYKE